MPEMKTLNGYEVVDAQAREDIKGLQEAIENIDIPEADLTSYAQKSELPTKVSQLQNDSNFITREDIPSEYITESELEAKNYASKVLLTSRIAEAKADLTETIESIQMPDLTPYALKTSIPTKVSQLTNDKSYLSSIPSEYVTESELNNKGYLTEHQSLTNYATKTYVENAIAENQPNLTKYALKSDIPDVSDFITSIPGEYVTENELSAKGYLTQHQSLAGYATEAFVTNKIAEAQLDAGDGDPIDLSGYATKDDIRGFISEIPSEYITETELNSKGYLTQHQSLADYAKKSEIPDVSNFISSIPSEYVTESELNAKGYLTQHQDISAYAKKSEVPTKVSQLSNDKNYLTSIPSEYVTQSDLESKGYLTEHQDISGKADKVHSHPEYLTEHQSLTAYATKTFVENTVAENQPNLSSYAKKTDIPDVTDFATKTYVEELLGVIENGSY